LSRKKTIVFSFSYILKLSSVDKSLLNNNLLNLIEKLKNFNSYITFQLNKIRNSKKEYTVLRSPFVYKKSREQFIIERQNSSFFLEVGLVH
jgi:ribosomal protein S10